MSLRLLPVEVSYRCCQLKSVTTGVSLCYCLLLLPGDVSYCCLQVMSAAVVVR